MSTQELRARAERVSLPVGRGVEVLRVQGLRIAFADADLILAYCLAVFVAAVIGKWVGLPAAHGVGFGNAFDIADINAGEALALGAMVSIALGARQILRLTSSDILVIMAGALFFLPSAPPSSPFIGATAAGLYFWWARRDSTALSSLGQLWIAISAHAAWGPFVFRILSAPILRLETSVIAALGHVAGLGLVVRDAQVAAPSGWSVYILGPCSSFHNLSLAMLVWLSLLKLGRDRIAAPAWGALFAGAGLIILLNMLRILLMTLSEADYYYWHDGSGRSIFICLTLAAIAWPTVLSRRSTRHEQAYATPR